MAAILARHVWSRVIVPPDFFDSALMLVTIVTISRHQSAEVSSRMVSAKTHVATSASQCAWYVLFFFSCSILSWIHTNNASIFSSLSRMRVFIFWPNKLKCACEKVKCACDKVIKNTCVRVWIQLYAFQTFPGPFFFPSF